MSYRTTLPEVFPYSIDVPAFECRVLVMWLFAPDRDEGYEIGSSFAVTVEQAPDTWRLWLSQVSYDRLSELGLLP